MSTEALGVKLGFIGGGMMASAMIGGILETGILTPEAVIVAEPSEVHRESFSERGINTTANNLDVVAFADVVVLAVKPHIVPLVLRQIKDAVGSTLLVSIAAGVPCDFIEDLVGGEPRVVRVMPNTPCLVGEAASAVCKGRLATDDDLALVSTMMGAVGCVVTVGEGIMDAVTGLSGSGPAYVYQFIEALADGGVRAGLPRPTAMTLAAQLVKGAATMVQVTGKHPGELKDQVCSAGGTTITGVHALERGGFRAATMDAVLAASNRSAELREMEKAKL